MCHRQAEGAEAYVDDQHGQDGVRVQEMAVRLHILVLILKWDWHLKTMQKRQCQSGQNHLGLVV